jgi:hypothetical protein
MASFVRLALCCLFVVLFSVMQIEFVSCEEKIPREVYQCIDNPQQKYGSSSTVRSNLHKDYIKYNSYALPDAKFFISFDKNDNRKLI